MSKSFSHKLVKYLVCSVYTHVHCVFFALCLPQAILLLSTWLCTSKIDSNDIMTTNRMLNMSSP